MGFGLIATGLVFLINPVINVFDVIPDLIGFLLIVIGLTKMSYFYDKIDHSRKFFFYLAICELLKIASIFLIVNRVDNGQTKVLLSFVFSLGEAALFVPAVIWLFEGLSTVSMRFNGKVFDASVKNSHGKTKDKATAVRNYIIFFYILRSAATLLPELTELEMYDNVGSVSKYSRPLTDYKPMMYKLLSFIVIVFAVIFAVKVIKFFSSMNKDKAFIDAFMNHYEETKTARPGFFLAKRMKLVLALFSLSVLFSATVIIDDINVLIGSVSSLFLIAAILFMRKYSSGTVPVLIVSVLRFFTAIASFVLQIKYFDNYSAEAVEWVDKAANEYYLMAHVSSLDKLLAFAAFILFVIILVRSIREHLKICGIMAETVQYSKKNRDAETMKSVIGASVLFGLFALVANVSGALFRYLVLSHEIFIVLNAVLEIIFIAYAFYYVSKIDGHIYDRED